MASLTKVISTTTAVMRLYENNYLSLIDKKNKRNQYKKMDQKLPINNLSIEDELLILTVSSILLLNNLLIN